jgi:4a-hydroxytetrahydrobiopterin dehydratase
MARTKLSAEELPAKLSEVNSWERRDEKIFKRFNFENFAESLAFVNKIGAIAEKIDHHPDITFGWGYAEVYTTTHDAGGLTANDFDLAQAIDKL